MSWSFPIGRLFGSELRVHVTFFLLLAWVALSGWGAGGLSGALVNTLFILALFACVIAHEFGHALMARRFGIHTPDVTLLPIGGLARLERMPEKPAQEIAVALAGPAVNIVIWAVLSLFLAARGDAQALDFTHMSLSTLPWQLAQVNLTIALFNLIPAFPMDGGRVLRALLASRMDRVTATRRAAQAGQALAFVMGLMGLLYGSPILMLIGLFVLMAAGAESADVAMQSVARGLMARDAMITEFEALSPDDGLDAAGAALIRTTQHEFPVIDPATGAFVGMLTRNDLFQALSASPRPRDVRAIMRSDIPRASLSDGLEKVLEKLSGNVPAVAIVNSAGGLVGYVTRENVGELMVLANARRSRG